MNQILNALPDIPRLYTAISEWVACLVYLMSIGCRKPPKRTIPVLVVGLGVLIGVQYWAGSLPIAFWIFSMCVAVACMYSIIMLASSMQALTGAYVLARAFVLAELIASLHWQIDSFLRPPTSTIYAPASIALLVAIYGGCGLLAWWGERRNFGVGDIDPPGRSVFIAATISVVTFAMSNLSFVSTNTPFSGRVGLEVFYIRTLVDLCGFALLYAQQEQVRENQASAELASINARAYSQHREYMRSKENLEAMGRLAHDLKHQIAALRAEIDPERQSRNFEELEASIQRYGSQQHTGNPVLDVVLSTKERICADSGITLTVVADGSLLAGMTPIDVSTLFGNALDNAIEALKKVDNPDRRLIKVALFSRDRFAVLQIDNTYASHLNWKANGELATTKRDNVLHGYGVKSIRHIAHKYQGEMTLRAKDHWFHLCVLLPMVNGQLKPTAASATL
ncbi:MAG: GHKL domain-containing protein [Bifidobacteriales bacterium]|nr:sensor histidine kinase [Bifidobacterium indicum]MCT6877806.1 GHKL domain-containing protein [Bifidobacteriales bacterium]